MLSQGVTPEEYLDPEVPPGLPWRDLPVVDLDDPVVAGLALVVEGDPEAFPVPVLPWPFSGSRPLDPGTGTGGGITEGTFHCWWEGNTLLARNEAVGGHYVLGWSVAPERAAEPAPGPPGQVLLWHVNHHPDGGQMFWSLDGRPFLVPAIPPGPDPDLDRAVVIRSDGSRGLCLLPEVWHDGVYPERGDGSFLTRQGAVHARVSCTVSAEMGCLLRVPLP